MIKQLTVGDLREQLKGYPKNMQIVIPSDDEGNSFRVALFGATPGYHLDYEFISVDEASRVAGGALDPMAKDYEFEKGFRSDVMRIKDKGVASLCIG